jgi:hypothetical protein
VCSAGHPSISLYGEANAKHHSPGAHRLVLTRVEGNIQVEPETGLTATVVVNVRVHPQQELSLTHAIVVRVRGAGAHWEYELVDSAGAALAAASFPYPDALEALAAGVGSALSDASQRLRKKIEPGSATAAEDVPAAE